MNTPEVDRITDRRGIISWCLFDWANSPFPAIVLTFVIPAYFTRAVAADAAVATEQWGIMTSMAALAIALLSPVLGAIADQGRGRLPWLAGFTALTGLSTAALWFVEPDAADAAMLLWLVGLGVVGFEIGMVFYNAMLPALAPDAMIGRISGWAWGLGYIGGMAGLVLVLFGFVQTETAPMGLDKEAGEHVRIAGPIVALWLVIFCVPIFLWTPDVPGAGKPAGAAVREGLRTLITTLRALPQHGRLVRFLIGRMIYMDGVNTLFAFGGVYAAGTFGMSVEEVIAFGILLNVTAGLGALGFAWVDDWIGAKPTVLIALVAITLIGIPMLIVETKLGFWVFGAALGVFFGPVQAASRSLMARMAPPGMETEMFGLYALSGKVTAFAGPLIVGIVAASTGSQRWGLATVLPFLVVGGLLLWTVRSESRERL
ncbi:MAG: MFS transporter [Alphaproteobacteria bacterium]|jgi:UMF1 family MFS transporter